jgi:hypothetical protein
MTDDRLDLTPLDPTVDGDRFGRIVSAIMERAVDELEARRSRASALAQLVTWRKPMLAAAAILLLLCGGVLFRVRVPEATSQVEYEGIAEAIGVPTVLAQGMRSDQLPSTAELLFGF